MKQMICIFCLILFSLIGCKNDENDSSDKKKGSNGELSDVGYDTVYRSGRFILLSVKSPDNADTGFLVGRDMPDQEAVDMINAYRLADPERKKSLHTGYIEHDFDGLFNFLDEQKEIINKASGDNGNSNLAIRFYPALHDNKLTCVTGLVHMGKAVWMRTAAVGTPVENVSEDIKAYNFGSLCPTDCGNKEDEGIERLPKQN